MKLYPKQSVCPHCKTIYRRAELDGLKWKKQTECYHCHKKIRVTRKGFFMLALELLAVYALLNVIMLGAVQGVTFWALFIVNIIPAAAAIILLPLYADLEK